MDDRIKEYRALALEALERSYAPYSQFNVAAVIEDDHGHVHAGTNIENASYGLTICAERSAICHMVQNGCLKIRTVVVLCRDQSDLTPCGTCRQSICEFSNPSTEIYSIHGPDHQEVTRWTIEDLLPHSFTLPQE